MNYATQDDLVNRFGEPEIIQISNETPSDTIDADRVTLVLTDTDARIDGFLGSRFTLPLTTIPPALTGYACDIARYLLARLPTDEMRARYEDALRWLGKVAKGEYGLGVDAEGDTPAASPGIAVSSQRPVFTRGTLRDYLDPAEHTGGRR
jgi:phage gp36-like protein